MKILRVLTAENRVIQIGDHIRVKFNPVVNDEEDKENPIEKEVEIVEFKPVDDGSGEIMIVGDDGQHYFDSNIIF